ncbi:hypothetical protein Q2K19_22375 [Micromonospora soli]|uniref:hypothetical protein n=1 Tax=Micromonospora sp. NBRC 110009 TaxID=3061627 RepID=UPI002673119A|nr:hypothetical protein [Micromonospora sp. NBRC 110009]WKT96917.1 hypothetical protein Q2K19_22375 [Micromonospora sp. NBRC 110009]
MVDDEAVRWRRERRQRFLQQVADEHYKHIDRIAEDVPLNAEHSNPHDGMNSDYNEHHATVSATPEQEDEHNQKIMDLIEEYRRDIGAYSQARDQRPD